MVNFTLSLLLLSFFVLLLSFNFGTNMAQDIPPGMKAWCVAKASASEAELKSNIEYVCNQGFACNIIQEGGQCYGPNTLINHASVLMNLYFQKYGHSAYTCSFNASGLIVLTDPSYGNCLYPYN